ncbi:unnamed protein product [Larinioides sclopetarius]|uniref:MATH domain-containing protein n=1 Tax=Larinioides sclopetarius TaxID=280406 RepID=A0AAV2BFJ1_9ARAC
MTEPVRYLEEECFSVYWKIKNFSYFCKKILYPEFSLSGDSYRLILDSETSQIVCEVSGGYYNPQPTSTMQISFLACDGSPEESISGEPFIYLQLARDVIFGKRRDAFLPEDTLTVRVRFRTDSERGKIFLYSQIGVTRKYFLWTLKDFSKHTCFEKKCTEKLENLRDVNLIFKSMDGINPTERFGIEISRSRG